MNTQHSTSPQETATVAPLSASDRAQILFPTRNKLALYAYYLGIFSLVPIFGFGAGIAAIIIGKQSYKISLANPTPGAREHAQMGIILGWVGVGYQTAFLLLMTVVFFIGN